MSRSLNPPIQQCHHAVAAAGQAAVVGGDDKGCVFGMAAFNPINYVMDLTWINNKTFGGTNDSEFSPYETKYWNASMPEAKPAPTTTPMKAKPIPIPRL